MRLTAGYFPLLWPVKEDFRKHICWQTVWPYAGSSAGSGLLAAWILTWTESQASHPSTRALQCGPLRVLQRRLSGFRGRFMAWVCLFPNARSTHMRHTGPDHGPAPFPLRAASQQAGTNAEPSAPTTRSEHTRLSHSLHGAPQGNLGASWRGHPMLYLVTLSCW